MKFLLITTLLSFNVFAQVENQPVTQKQFETIRAKQVAKEAKDKTPYLLPANTLVNNTKKYGEKVFRVMIIGDTIVSPTGNSKACGFNYLKLVDDTGFEAKTGFGQYYIESLKGHKCRKLLNIEGQDVSSVDLKVKFVSLARSPQDANKLIPVLEVVK